MRALTKKFGEGHGLKTFDRNTGDFMKKLLVGLLALGSINCFAATISKQITVSAAAPDCVRANIKLDKAIKEASKNQKVLDIKLFECNQQSFDNGEIEYQQGAHRFVEVNSVIGNY
jgi:hypothetical protein